MPPDDLEILTIPKGGRSFMRTGHRTDYVKLEDVKTLLATEYVHKSKLPTTEEIEKIIVILKKEIKLIDLLDKSNMHRNELKPLREIIKKFKELRGEK